MHTGSYPAQRLRRLRRAEWLREMTCETILSPSDLVWPIFVEEGSGTPSSIEAMPGVKRQTIRSLKKIAKEAHDVGIPALALFPVVPSKRKSERAEEALNPDNLICRAIAAVKESVPEIGIIADVALDPYTAHGHDGIVKNGDVANDETVEILTKQAVILASAGADIVAPSDMMDGRVKAIRTALDQFGFSDIAILSYAAKYASAFYGPFRDAVGSKSALGKAHKRSYQMQPGNLQEALREVAHDIREGADMVMVKPAGSYLDIISAVNNEFSIPVAAYQVSGEYSMIMAAAERGWLNAPQAFHESLLSIKRAGAKIIFSYYAYEIANQLNKGEHHG